MKAPSIGDNIAEEIARFTGRKKDERKLAHALHQNAASLAAHLRTKVIDAIATTVAKLRQLGTNLATAISDHLERAQTILLGLVGKTA